MTGKKLLHALIVLTILCAFTVAGCSTHGKYYSSKSKQYKKLKRRYEKYDCGCNALKDTTVYLHIDRMHEALF